MSTAPGSVFFWGEDFIIRSNSTVESQLKHAFKRTDLNSITLIQDTLTRVAQRVIVGEECQKVLDEPNAGGASVVSEALSVEYMTRRFGITDVVTEMSIQYWFPNWKRIDYIANYPRTGRVGVSVTRAMGFPFAEDFTMDDAHRLCQKKLKGLVIARQGISAAHSYERSVLHCFCQSEEISNMMFIAFHLMLHQDQDENPDAPTLSGSITLILTVCDMEEVYTDDLTCMQ